MVSSDDRPWHVAELLAEPTRRRVYETVRRSREPMTRDQTAAVTGLNRRLAAFHLDRLAEAGLLRVDYARPAGRTGPGAGRPAKRYLATAVELDLCVPPRRYDVIARLLAEGVTNDPAHGTTGALVAAYDEGLRIGRATPRSGRRSRARDRSQVLDSLCALGYEPVAEAADTLRLANCPFRTVANASPELVCGMNHELVRGLLDGLDLDPSRAVLSPAPNACCVTVRVA